MGILFKQSNAYNNPRKSDFVLNAGALRHNRMHLFTKQSKFHFGIFLFPQRNNMSIANSFAKDNQGNEQIKEI